jgi:hypothetical protein
VLLMSTLFGLFAFLLTLYADILFMGDGAEISKISPKASVTS